MKNRKILRILGLALIFSLFMAVVPAAPALAYDYDITLSSAQGMIGATITVTGSDFVASTINTDKWYRIIFSPTSASVGQYIDTTVLTYEVVREFDTDYDGEFSTTFAVPSACTDGNPDADVAPATYYVYIADGNTIRAKSPFTLIQALS